MALDTGKRGEFGVEPAEITFRLGEYSERRKEAVRLGHLFAIQFPAAKAIQGGSDLVSVEHPGQLGRGAVRKLSEKA